MARLAAHPRLDRRRSSARGLRQSHHGQAPGPPFDGAPLAGRPRPGRDAEYRLVEIHAAEGWWEQEMFLAPDDATAWRRVLEATSGEVVVLWRGDRLVGMRPSGQDPAQLLASLPGRAEGPRK